LRTCSTVDRCPAALERRMEGGGGVGGKKRGKGKGGETKDASVAAGTLVPAAVDVSCHTEKTIGKGEEKGKKPQPGGEKKKKEGGREGRKEERINL